MFFNLHLLPFLWLFVLVFLFLMFSLYVFHVAFLTRFLLLIANLHTDSGQTDRRTDSRTGGQAEAELVLLTYTRMEKINIRGSDVGFLANAATAETVTETETIPTYKKNNYYKYI